MLDEFNSIRRFSDEIILSHFVPEQELLTQYVSLEMKKVLDDWNKMAFNKNNLQLKNFPSPKEKRTMTNKRGKRERWIKKPI